MALRLDPLADGSGMQIDPPPTKDIPLPLTPLDKKMKKRRYLMVEAETCAALKKKVEPLRKKARFLFHQDLRVVFYFDLSHLGRGKEGGTGGERRQGFPTYRYTKINLSLPTCWYRSTNIMYRHG